MHYWNAFVRANYLVAVIYGALLAALILLSFVAWWPTDEHLPLVVALTLLYALPAIRAIRRRWAKGVVIPPDLVHERPIVAIMVSLASSFGHFFFAISAWGAIEIALAPEWPDEAGKIGVFIFDGPVLLSHRAAVW